MPIIGTAGLESTQTCRPKTFLKTVLFKIPMISSRRTFGTPDVELCLTAGVKRGGLPPPYWALYFTIALSKFTKFEFF